MLHRTRPTFTRCASLLLLVALPGACGPRRDWAAFQEAFADAGTSTGTSGESSTSGGPADADSHGGSTSEASSTTGTGSTESTDASAASETTGAADPGTSSSGDPQGVCGDGIVALGEECDDANDVDTDECDNSCARAWFIFVTGDAVYTGDIHGIVGADTRCRSRAGNALLPRHDKYRALISDSTTNAADRLHHARGYYRLVNGLPVAHGWDALMHDTLENPIVVTEVSTTLKTSVWTGTLPGGTAVPGAAHCNDWLTNSPQVLGHYGSNAQVSAAWINDPEPKVNPAPCIISGSI
ncbi:MAG TPA: DUF4215 domain-containing protein, partial [Nannocystis sp.]